MAVRCARVKVKRNFCLHVVNIPHSLVVTTNSAAWPIKVERVPPRSPAARESLDKKSPRKTKAEKSGRHHTVMEAE